MPLTSFDYFKKKLNFRLVNLQGTVERVLNVLSILLAFAALGGILYEHGGYLTPQQETMVTVVVTIAFIFAVQIQIFSAKLTASSLIFVTLLICVASPVNTYFRYAMPYVFILPSLTILFIKRFKEQ